MDRPAAPRCRARPRAPRRRGAGPGPPPRPGCGGGGPDPAVEHLLDNGVDARTADRVWEAIALHTSTGIAQRRGLLCRLVATGTGLDFGVDSEAVTDGMAADLHDRYPRPGTASALHAGIVGQARAVPAKAPVGSPARYLVEVDDLGAPADIPMRWGD
ncbi:hypothetical protein K7G98_18830 [Saccharothrix sp. MB29]|nr:hypothetical protein [Saccharothrix sp. MB29]